MSNPIKQIQLYPLKEQNVANNTFMMNSNVNNVEIGDHFQINRKERYQDIQKERKSYESDNYNDRPMNSYNNEDVNNYNMQSLKEVNALQEQFNALKCDIYSMSTVGNKSDFNSPVNNNNVLISPTMQQTQMVQQQLQQQYKHLLQQQQQQLINQQQQQQKLQMKKRSNDLTINTHFDADGTIRKGKHGNTVMFNLGDNSNHQGLTLDTNRFSGEQTLLSGETTSARNTIVNRNDVFISPGNMSHVSNGLSTGNSNNMNVQTNYAPPVNYNSRMSLYTPVSNLSETPQSYYNSPYEQEGNNYKYTTQDSQNRLSDITIDPYAELRKYNYLSIVPRSAESISENMIESFNTNSYVPSMQPPPKVQTYAQ